MIKPLTKLHFEPTTTAACIKAKRQFHGYCVISGMSPESRPIQRGYELDAAHVLPRSTFPEVAKCVQNILPIIRIRHSWRGHPKGDFGALDFEVGTLGVTRTPIDRIKYLVDNVHSEFRPMVFDRLRMLFIEGSKLHNGGAILSRRDEALSILEANDA
jgi:hypothetical protein